MSPLIHLYIAQSVLDARIRSANAAAAGEGSSPGTRSGRARSHSNVSHPAPLAAAAAATSSGPASLAQSNQLAALEQLQIEQQRELQEELLQEIVDLAAENGVLLTTTKRNWSQEMVEHRPSIRICVTSALTKKEIEKAGTVIKNAAQKVLGKSKK